MCGCSTLCCWWWRVLWWHAGVLRGPGLLKQPSGAASCCPLPQRNSGHAPRPCSLPGCMLATGEPCMQFLIWSMWYGQVNVCSIWCDQVKDLYCSRYRFNLWFNCIVIMHQDLAAILAACFTPGWGMDAEMMRSSKGLYCSQACGNLAGAGFKHQALRCMWLHF
jgi:hypothetical protein